MRLAAIDVGGLADVIWVSLVAGVFVSASFSLVVLGGARSADARRSGRDAAAAVYAGLAVLAFLAFAAAVGFGVQIMLSKD